MRAPTSSFVVEKDSDSASICWEASKLAGAEVVIALGFCRDAGMVTVDLSMVFAAGLDVENWRTLLPALDLATATARRQEFIMVVLYIV